MTSVNSPACLLARNHFYRSVPSSPDGMNPSPQQNLSVTTQMLLWIRTGIPPGLPVAMGTKGLLMEIALGSSSSPGTKPANPADQHVKQKKQNRD